MNDHRKPSKTRLNCGLWSFCYVCGLFDVREKDAAVAAVTFAVIATTLAMAAAVTAAVVAPFAIIIVGAYEAHMHTSISKSIHSYIHTRTFLY